MLWYSSQKNSVYYSSKYCLLMTKGLITWRISARAEISARLGGLKFCCDYMTTFSPGWDISLGAKYEIAREMAPRTRIVKIGTLLLSQFGLLTALNFQLFGMITAFKMMELKRNLSLAAYLSARKTYLQKKKIYLQARRVHHFPDSLALFNLVCIEVDVIYIPSWFWALKLERLIKFFLLLPLFHWNRFYFVVTAILFSAFQPGLKFRFDYMGFFQIFQPVCPGWKS